MSRAFAACRNKVHNRGRPPVAFLDELIDWGRSAPDDIFATNDRDDVYSLVGAALGPWVDLKHRKAVMLEVLRVLAGFESSWDWNEGVDVTNPDSNTPCTTEAGIFQCSGNSMNFDSSLKDLVRGAAGTTDCIVFQRVTKQNHAFAIEYCARLLRFTVRHHGPLRDRDALPWLRRDAVDEFSGFLS